MRNGGSVDGLEGSESGAENRDPHFFEPDLDFHGPDRHVAGADFDSH